MRRFLAGVVPLIGALSACEAPPSLEQQAPNFAAGWFAAARDGQRNDTLCHGLGALKHPEFTCAEQLEHAAAVQPESRVLARTRLRDCFDTVCGEFVELAFDGTDDAGNAVEETLVLKRDNERVQAYWYRSTSLLAAYRSANPEPDADEKDPLQAAYDEVTATYPALYTFPPCYGVRASSATLRTPTMRRDAMDAPAVEAAAAACGERFCLTLIGEKMAGLCPN